jgi:mRNA interferase YafQ
VVRKRKPKPEPAAEPSKPASPLVLVPSNRFKRDLARQAVRGKDLAKLHVVVTALRARLPLDSKHRDHALSGDWTGYRDCHIEPDWVLVYQFTESELHLTRTGTHSDLKLT